MDVKVGTIVDFALRPINYNNEYDSTNFIATVSYRPAPRTSTRSNHSFTFFYYFEDSCSQFANKTSCKAYQKAHHKIGVMY